MQIKNLTHKTGIEKSGITHKINPLVNYIYFAKNIGATQVVLSKISEENTALAKEFKAN